MLPRISSVVVKCFSGMKISGYTRRFDYDRQQVDSKDEPLTIPRLTFGSSNCASMKDHCLILFCKIVTTRFILPCKMAEGEGLASLRP